MTELRSKRDRSDTGSLMTVDEITAEMENRVVESAASAVDSDDWTKVDGDDSDEDDAEATLEDEGSEEEEEEEEETLNEVPEDAGGEDEEEEEQGLSKVRGTRQGMSKFYFCSPRSAFIAASKWIKGALIGAGSFGKVYLGMDAANGLLMAVKQVELPSGTAANQERKQSMLTALEREIEFLQDLQHDNIVQYLCKVSMKLWNLI